MLELRNCVFKQGNFELNADLSVIMGARVAIIGPSGGGKSTLLSGISGFLTPTKGSLHWDGTPMLALPGDRPLTTLFQAHNLFPHLSVFKNVALGLHPGLRLGIEQKAKVHDVLVQVGLADKANTLPSDLSGGQQGRVALARALLRERPLLLLDEPFAALGPALKDEMLGLLSDLLDQTQATALMVTHDPKDALAFASQAILVADNTATPPQPIQDLFDNPPPALRAYLGSRT